MGKVNKRSQILTMLERVKLNGLFGEVIYSKLKVLGSFLGPMFNLRRPYIVAKPLAQLQILFCSQQCGREVRFRGRRRVC